MATHKFEPTAEQKQAVDLSALGESLAIEALAGAGKTSTLELIARRLEEDGKTGQYVAFNKKIVTEAQGRFPRSVACSTAHSLAFQAVGKHFRPRLNGRRVTARDTAIRLGLDIDAPFLVLDREIGGESEVVEIAPERAAGLAKVAVTNFCRTADDEIEASHVAWLRGLDTPGETVNNRILTAKVLPLARKIWEDLQRPDGDRFRFEHNHYLKIWQLQGPAIYADYILIDEAQDLNPLMRAVVESQDETQLIWVGDSHQQIYSWNGAVNALAEVDTVNRTHLTESFRFGPEIAEQANHLLGRLGADVKVTGAGKPGMVGDVDEPDVYLGRTNAMVVAQALELMAEGLRVAVQGGTRDIVWFAESAEALMLGASTDHPDLACFKNWGQVLTYVIEDEEGKDLAPMVNLIEGFGAQQIIQGLRRAEANEGDADCVVSTAHKSKGAEWASVGLLDDFPDDPAPEELRLLYVAVTRAMGQLDIGGVDVTGARLARAAVLKEAARIQGLKDDPNRWLS